MWPGMWVTSRTWSFGWDLRKVRVEFLPGKKKVEFRLLAEALRQVSRVAGGGADEKVVIERLCLSIPCVEKPFNSKVIKSFVPELRSRKCFLCFGIPMLSIYVRYEHYERFAYRYEYVYFTYSYLAMQRWEGYEILYPPSLGLYTTTIDLPQWLLWH